MLLSSQHIPLQIFKFSANPSPVRVQVWRPSGKVFPGIGISSFRLVWEQM